MADDRPREHTDPGRARRVGVVLASIAGAISGVTVFVNGYGVKQFPDPTTYTTAKNLVAAVLLAAALAVRARATASAPVAPGLRRHAPGLATIAGLGGGVAFVLFFEGLSRANSGDAAFVQKSLVIWVAILAVPLLGERLGPWHLAAIGLLVAGQALLARDLTSLRPSSGELLVLAATLLWAVEVIVAKRVLAEVPPLVVATVRMVGGVVVLVAWVVVSGRVDALAGHGVAGWSWALVTGGLLAAYVATWYAALSRAPAIDVTAMLVPAAVVTAALDGAARGVPLPAPAGLVLVVAGAAVIALTTWRATDPRRAQVVT